MAKKAAGKRYARAVFELAREKNALDAWQSDLSAILRVKENAEVVAVLKSPRVPFDARAKLLRDLLPGISPLALNLAYLLTARDSLDMIEGIASEYERLVNEHRGIATAEVTTAVALDEAEKQKLAERLSAITGKQVAIKPRVDPGIIGGVIARVNDKLLDGSTRSRLLALRQKMVRQ